MNLGRAIKSIRNEKKLGQGELAGLVGISQTSLYLIEKNERRPSGKTLKKICKELDVPETLLYLYGMEEGDVSEAKKEKFKHLYPMVQDIIKKLVSAE